MNVLVEGRICTHVLSFTSLEYLFTATVCRAWKENAESVHTDVAAAFESPSRIKEGVENGLCCQCRDRNDEPSCDFYMEYAEIVDADVDVFRSIHEMGYAWGRFTMQNAAIGHKIDIIKFMHEHGCPLNSSVLFNAVNANCLELVQYLAEHKCPIDVVPAERRNTRSLEQAISKNFTEIVKCLRSDMGFPFDDDTFKVACNADYPKNLHTLAYLHAEGCEPSPFLLYDMIKDGNFHAVQFMLKHRLHDNKGATAMCIAVARFQCNIMRILVQYGFEVNDDVVDLATYDMGLVKWLIRISGKQKPCRPTSRAYINTIEYDIDHAHCIDVLEWLRYHWKLDVGFASFQELQENQRWSQALEKRDDSVADWFKENI